MSAPARSILVVDDQLPVARAIAQLLDRRGDRTKAVSTGEAAMHELATHVYDVIITDVVMPGIDGLEIIAAARRKQPQAVIVVMSGGGDSLTASDALARARKLGVARVLQKPFSPDELVKATR